MYWWFRNELKQLARAVIRRDYPVDLLAAECAGGVAGLFGTYRRSLRRARAIRLRHG